MTQLLPAQFNDLTRFVEKWDLPGTNERYAQRLGSRFEDLEDFHAAVRRQLPDIKNYLDARDFSEYSDADRRLSRLAFAWPIVAEAVEVFKQPRVPDSKMYWNIKAEAEV